MRVAVISLKRTPERWADFLARNERTLANCDLRRINGIDGDELSNSNIKPRIISSSAQRLWSPGAIGIGLSHLFCWRICYNSKSPLVVLEDDVILADDWQTRTKKIINPDSGLILLGWNLDSVLRAEFSAKQEMISLFEPAYPNEEEIRNILNSGDLIHKRRLNNAFGLAGYWIHPKMALLLLNKIKELKTVPLNLGRGLPQITTHGIDGLLNLHYWELGAEVVIPPLAIALNDPLTSLTRKTPDNFSERRH